MLRPVYEVLALPVATGPESVQTGVVVETVTGRDAALEAARLLHDFNVEYDDPTPPAEELAPHLLRLVEADQVTVLLARGDDGRPVGVAVLRLQPSVWSEALEAYLAELYVVPSRRGEGHGRALLEEVARTARGRGADYAFLVTSEDDRSAQRAYEAAGWRRTEGEGGPVMWAYERDL